jgi:hypothetical protein
VFGRSKKTLFEPYGRRRSRRWLPGWLVLLLVGIGLGVVAVIFVQQRYLPPRLSAAESAALRSDYAKADGDRRRLQEELGLTRQQLALEQAKSEELAGNLAARHESTQQLRDDLATVIGTLPPDPRGGQVEVRAAQFVAKDGKLSYDIVLTRDSAEGKPPMAAVLQLVVTGQAGRDEARVVTLEPVKLSLGRHEIVSGTAALPDDFKPRQTRVQVLDREGGKALGMRVLLVR